MFKKIMVPLDGSEVAECVIPYVDGFIEQGQVDAIVFVRVIRPISMATALAATEESNQAFAGELLIKLNENEGERKFLIAEYLSDVVKRLKQNRVKLQTAVLVGKVADSLLHYAENNGIDLILLATHGRSGVSRWVRGSVAERVLRASPIPVLIIRAPAAGSDKQD
ncbi:MAG: universal stress protein [Desulfobacterales bacterium]|nr:universal stress protein [Desulfobacterales bacterium]